MMADPELVELLKSGPDNWNQQRPAPPRMAEWSRRPNRLDLRGVDVSGSTLSGANLNAVDLSGADLTGTNLDESSMSRSRFDNATLEQAILHFTTAVDSSFENAILNKASLFYAEFRGGSLKKAQFCGALMIGTRFERVSLAECNLGGASLAGAIFTGVDLSDAVGCDTSTYHLPSSLGIESLYLSNGRIPDSFLRGIGVAEPMITFANSLVTSEPPIRFYSCFISYSHADSTFARRLTYQLQGRGVRCFRDDDDVRVGERILPKLIDAIRVHDRVVLCCSRTSLESKWVATELEETFEKEKELGKDILLPLNLDGYLFDGWKGPHAVKVRERNAANFVGWEHDNDIFEAGFKRVLKALGEEVEGDDEG